MTHFKWAMRKLLERSIDQESPSSVKSVSVEHEPATGISTGGRSGCLLPLRPLYGEVEGKNIFFSLFGGIRGGQ